MIKIRHKKGGQTVEMTTCTKCGKEVSDGLECINCGTSLKMQGHYQLVCYAYYCGWKSDVTEDLEEIESIEKCPRCGVVRGSKLQVEVV